MISSLSHMGLFSRSKPKIKIQTSKKDGFSGWIQCSGCSELVHAKELEATLACCPRCGYHYRLTLTKRLDLLTDEGSLEEMFQDMQPLDVLGFVDTESYLERLKVAQAKTGRSDAIWTGLARLSGIRVALAVLDFSFMGGSMGSVVGEKLTLLIEWALEKRLPLIVVSSSGGARMQESALSLMQMAKTSAALARFQDHGLVYISVLTNPTTGGVTASFATLGDLIIAEPDALIAFAGPRVVEQTMRQKLPADAQKSKFLLDKGMVDCVVPRRELKKKLSFFLWFCQGGSGSSVDQKEVNRLKELLAIGTGVSKSSCQ
jgi:acetyl-CoA carboxylase carboxyl transferase subunit beta